MSDRETPDENGAVSTRPARLKATARVATCASVVAFVLAAFPAAAAAITPYIVGTSAAPASNGATLSATIYPYGFDTTYHFEYGPTISYGTNIPMPEADAGAGSYSVPDSQTVTGLQPSTTYHYRLVATNSAGTREGSDRSFTTPANPNTPPPSPEPEPSGKQTKSGKVRVKEARYKGRTILTTANRRTLYSLSAEKKGKFICTKRSGCLGIWHPLLLPHGAKLVGPVKLGTVRRPDGGVQVTFHGRPLYTFAQDMKPGQVKGDGLKDVGTWHPATVSKRKR